jgi:xanthine dehydrogenase YagT iron-sulfur-binding subunit
MTRELSQIIEGVLDNLDPPYPRTPVLIPPVAARLLRAVPSDSATSLLREAHMGLAGTSVTTGAITLTVNGRTEKLEVDCRTSLLDALREHLQLTGTKKGCDHGRASSRCNWAMS